LKEPLSLPEEKIYDIYWGKIMNLSPFFLFYRTIIINKNKIFLIKYRIWRERRPINGERLCGYISKSYENNI
jgi:hypothetical protein